jgi:hypothetical protein
MFMLLFLSLFLPPTNRSRRAHAWPGYLCHRENRASAQLTLAEPVPAQIASLRFRLLEGCRRQNANNQD